MAAIVGYYDLNTQLPENTLEKMLTAVYGFSSEAQSHQTIWGGLGVIGHQFDNHCFSECLDSSIIAMTGEFETDINGPMPRLDKLDNQQISLLRGGFIWIQMDVIQQRFFIVNDQFARHPFYIVKYRDAILFSTQIKALLVALPDKLVLDKSSIAMMLSIGELVGNQTLIEGVETLPAATILNIDREGYRQQHYWQYSYQQDFSIIKKDAVQSVGEMLVQSVQRSVNKSESVCVPLSGGLDSRFILGLANQQVDVHAYTWGVPECRDLIYAKKTSQKIKCKHDCFEFSPNYLEKHAEQGVWITEGQLPVVNFHVLPYVSRLARDGASVLLDGFAGDAVLGGNFIQSAWMDNSNDVDVADKVWHWRLNNNIDSIQREAMSSILEKSQDIFKNVYSRYQGETSMDSVMAFLMDNRVRRITTGGTDIFRTKFSVKQPFMDVDLIQTINCVPHEWRKRHRFYLEVLNKFAPDVASVPWQRTCLPPSVPYPLSWLSLAGQRAYKETRKYLPLPDLLGNNSPSQFSDWFRCSLKSYVENVLFSERTYDRNVLPMDVLEMAWRRHQADEVDASGFLGAAMSIELFARLFIDDLDTSIQQFTG